MNAKTRGQMIIREALGRAMYDCPRYMLVNFRKGYDQSTGAEIARRMLRELDHAGWRAKGSTRREAMDLEDAIRLGLSMADAPSLASDDPARNSPARDKAAHAICQSLGYSKVTLVRKSERAKS